MTSHTINMKMSKASAYSAGGSYKSFQIKTKMKPEPFDETILKDCTPYQLQMKIEFLKKDIVLLNCVCEALEMYLVKVQPELINRDIDVSWMPYDFSNVKRETVNDIPKEMKDAKRKLSAAPKASIMYSAIKHDVMKISIFDLIFELKKVVMVMDADFNKHYNEQLERYKIIQGKLKISDTEYIRIIQFNENFKLKVEHPNTHIEKYENFHRHRRTMNELMIRDIRLKTSKVVNEQKHLREKFIKMKETLSKISEADCIQANLINKKKKQHYFEKIEMEKQVRSNRNTVRGNYMAKKLKMEKQVHDLNLSSIDLELKQIKNKILRTPFTPKMEEIFEDPNVIKENAEDIDNRIKHHITVKAYIEWSDKYIKASENKLERRNTIINLYCQKLKNISK